MKKYIRKSTEVFLILTSCTALVMLTAETTDGTISLPWTLGWMAALILSAKALSRMGVFQTK